MDASAAAGLCSSLARLDELGSSGDSLLVPEGVSGVMVMFLGRSFER